MDHLLAMILTACDRRKNPVAEVLACQASQAYESLVQLMRTADTSSVAAEDYTKKGVSMFGQFGNGTVVKAMTASGRVVSVCDAVCL